MNGTSLTLALATALAGAGLVTRRGSRAREDEEGETDRRLRAQAILPDCLGRDDYYHVTSLDAMPSILRRGLVPRKTGASFRHLAQYSKGRLFLAAGEDAGIAWWETIRANGRANPVLLRVERKAVRAPQFDSKGNSDVECSVFVTHGIPVVALSFWNPDVDDYDPLSEWVDPTPRLNEDGFLMRDESFCPNRTWGTEDVDEDDE